MFPDQPARPGDAFLGEEFGGHGRSRRRWIVDAIDGTASFIAGEPEWGTLIALVDHGTTTMGVVSAPACHRRWWAAHATGSWTSTLPNDTTTSPSRLAITGAAELHQAVIGIWPPPTRLSARDRSIAADLASRAGQTRPAIDWQATQAPAPPIRKPSTGSGTCHGALLVATGQLDAFLLLGAGAWDIAALIPIVQEAGGTYSDLSGSQNVDTGAALFANAALHRQILDIAGRTS